MQEFVSPAVKFVNTKERCCKNVTFLEVSTSLFTKIVQLYL